jgi:hypothetical protein
MTWACSGLGRSEANLLTYEEGHTLSISSASSLTSYSVFGHLTSGMKVVEHHQKPRCSWGSPTSPTAW